MMDRRSFLKAAAAAAAAVATPAVHALAEGGSQAAADRTNVAAGSRTLPMASLGPLNPWPRFRFQIPGKSIQIPDGLSDEDRVGMFTDAVVPPLPYLMQDNYTRERQPGSLPTVEVENESLRAVFYPSLGGRMMSLYDKRAQRELLFDNPVFQPANLAIRNAWFSGGVEWNGPLYGHSLLTCSPVFAGTVETARGPLVRLYEFDRALETTWQVDVFLPRGDDRLWVHVKAVNPNAHEVRFYWWTNIAVPLARDTRVLAPMDYSLEHVATGLGQGTFPAVDDPGAEGLDGSYPINYRSAKSVFFRKRVNPKPWLVCLDSEGRGLSHVSTQTLFGRKLFTWGANRGGRHWMDFLSEEGKGNYLEVQGGVTPTQLHTRPLPAGACIEWTECISPFAMDAQAAHGRDYTAACAAARSVIERRVPDADLRQIDAFLGQQADAPVGAVLHRGAGWGALHETRTGKRLSPGLAFASEPGEEERPWAELLAGGAFSAESLKQPPHSFNVSPGWTAVVRNSMQSHGPTWLHHLHLGVAQLEAGKYEESREEFKASLAMWGNASAQRGLALLAERDGDLDAAQSAYESAWKLAGDDQNLAVEIGEFFVRHRRHAAFIVFVHKLPAPLAQHERIAIFTAQIALEQGDCAMVRQLLQREFATIREGEVSLSELWFASYVQEAERRQGRQLTAAEREEIVEQFPPPRQIDFRMQ